MDKPLDVAFEHDNGVDRAGPRSGDTDRNLHGAAMRRVRAMVAASPPAGCG
jgi:hypothetical protein